MDAAELREIGVKLYGEWGWQTRVSEVLDVAGSTVRHWVAGDNPIPSTAAVALRCLSGWKRKGKVR